MKRSPFIAFLLFVFLTNLKSFAQDNAVYAAWSYYLDEINSINSDSLSAPVLCDHYKSGESRKLSKKNYQCIKAYQALYDQDEIEMSFYWGYLDHDGETHDQFFKKTMISNMLSDCHYAKYKYACGFKKDEKKEDTFYKMIKGLDGKDKKISVKVKSSSHSPIIKENENSKEGKKSQVELSEKIWKEFETSLKNDEVVFYIGHSRYGSGPDFGPINPYSFKAVKDALTKPNLERMKSAIASSQNPPRVIGMITCQATNYYADEIYKLAKNSALLMSNQSTAFPDNVPIAMTSLDSLLGMRCEDEMKKKLAEETQFYSTHKFDGSTYAEKVPALTGFFDKHEEYPTPAFLSPYLFLEEILVHAPSDKNLNQPINKGPSRGLLGD